MDQVVPVTEEINLDITIPHTYYNNQVLSNLEQESKMFPLPTAQHYERLECDTQSIENKLSEKMSQLRLKPHLYPLHQERQVHFQGRVQNRFP